MNREDDTDLIVTRLTDRIEQMLDQYASGWVAHKGAAYLSPKSQKDLGSFKVNLTGGRRGQWYRFSQGFGGGPVKLLAYILNGCSSEPSRSDLADAFKEARVFLGMDQGDVNHDAIQKARERREQQRFQHEAAEAKAREFNEELAMDLWQQAKESGGTLGQAYFERRVRGFTGPMPECIRFHPAAYVSKSMRAPCVVCRVDGPDGNPVGVWRIFLTPDGDNLRDENGAKIKKGLGPCAESGGAIRLFPATGGTVGACEGVETAFGAWNLGWQEIPVWSCMSTSGMVNFRPPFGIERVLIFPDGDRWKVRDGKWHEPPGFKAARTLHDRMIELGLVSAIDPVPADGQDHLERWNIAYDNGLRVGEMAA